MRFAIAAICFTAVPASQASSGELFASYRPHLRIAADWGQIAWADQTRIAREIGKEHDLSGGAEIDACLDLAARDIRYRELPFNLVLPQCIRQAKE
jgi:hypothetical protein